MAKNPIISNTLYWGAISFMAVIFVSTLLLNSYLFVLDNVLTQQVHLSKVALNKATLILQYNDQNKRIFEGDVPTGKLSLYDALLLSSEVGGIDIQFFKTNDGKIKLSRIENYPNNDKNYWEMRMPNVNWSKPLNDEDIDLQKIFINGGSTVYLIYK